MHEQQGTHTKGFLLEHNEENTLLWLRPDGVLLDHATGTVPFDGRYTHEEQEYSSWPTWVEGWHWT